VTLTIVVPGTSAMERRDHPLASGAPPFALGTILLPFVLMRRKKWRPISRLASILLLSFSGTFLVSGLSGCAAGNGPGHTSSSPQTYSLTVTATSGALSNTTTLTLTVE
jgi:hypothetical protein